MNNKIICQLLNNFSQNDENTKMSIIELINKIVESENSNSLNYLVSEYKNLNWNLQNDISDDVVLKIEKLLPIVERQQEKILIDQDNFNKIYRSAYDELYERIIKIEKRLFLLDLKND